MHSNVIIIVLFVTARRKITRQVISGGKNVQHFRLIINRQINSKALHLRWQQKI